MKGTYRTALEWAKLLLSLDPEEDPYCMRFMIHHLALRCQEYTWLLDVFSSEIVNMWTKAFQPFPHSAILHFKPSLVLAALHLRQPTKCRELLFESMQNVPWLFVRLFKELNLDAPPSIWGIEPRTDAEILFTEMYVLQTKDLWNAPEAVSLLMEVAHTIPKVASDAIPHVNRSEMDLNVVRFVYLENIPALMALVPSSMLHKSNNSESDPIPPEVSIYSYEAQRRALEVDDGSRGGLGGGDFMDPLAAIAQLMPNFRQGPEDAQLRRELEEAIAAEGPEVEEGEGPERAPISIGLARRLMNMFWSGPAEEEWEGESNTDTDEEMPELVGEEGDSEDEMPGLVAESDDETPGLAAPDT